MILDIEKLLLSNNIPLKNVIHVGGHTGEEISLYKKINPKSVIQVFEPNPNTFTKLLQTAANYTDVNCYNVALGSCQAVLPLFVENSNEGQSNSLLKPKLHVQQYPSIMFTETVNVQVTTLDSYNFNNTHNFLNMDVQGYELEVLKGSTQTLQNVQCILSEVNRAELYQDCCFVDDLDNFLKEYNFERVETNWLGNTWGDAFYIKKSKHFNSY